MKLLFENWRRFLLSERLMLKPGPNGWDLYGKLVAEAYERAPLFDDEAVYSFNALGPFVENMFGQIAGPRGRVSVEFVDENPYPSEKEMCLDAMQNGVLKIWKGGTEHPIFDPVLNAKLRAVHDYMAHCQGKTSFGQQGEIAAFNKHMKTVPEAGREALFTEVVGQASYFLNYGHFPEQKIAILKGFDKHNVGEVDPEITGYRLDPERKELIKV
tara:strand:- start:135 stop:776 length:642 start_codon:yes stop_codon:yes gene_type:complete